MSYKCSKFKLARKLATLETSWDCPSNFVTVVEEQHPKQIIYISFELKMFKVEQTFRHGHGNARPASHRDE